MKRYLTIGLIVALAASLGLTACRGKGGSSGAAPDTTGDQPQFNVSSATQLVALSNTVASTGSQQTGAGKIMTALGFAKKPLFQYQIVNQGLSDQEVKARAKGKSAPKAYQATSTGTQSGTNLLSVDAEGNAELAVESNYLIKVMYSVTDPSGEYVYLALDPGFIHPDGNDYTPFIAQNNCAFYRITIADDTAACVKEGVYIQPIDDVYLKRVSSNVKPIQFDGDGNLYFPATTFTRSCDDAGNCTMNAADWSPRIYRVAVADGSVIALTQDNQQISYYITLTTGELAYQSIDANGNTALYLWQKGVDPTINPNGKTVNLTGNTVGVDYFTADSYNTIMWGGWTESGIRFARPASSSSGLIEKATLDTNIYSTGQSGDLFGNSFPALRVIVGDDGRLYGVFQELSSEQDPNDPNKEKYFTTLKVYEVLPYNPIPKVQVKIPELNPIGALLGQNATWQQWLGSTPFQVSQGFIYYKERQEKIGFGNHDVIKMVSLTDRRTITLLGNDAYEIYTWRLRADKLYFSALDLNKTVVVAGEINTTIVKSNPLADPLSTFMKVQEISSAIGATSRVQDIESLAALPTENVTDPPAVTAFLMTPENIYSASIQFNKIMDKQSVEDNLSFKEVLSNTDIATMKVWINGFLHLIPDLQPNNVTPPAPNDPLLDLGYTKPLAFGTEYAISIGADATDTATPPVKLASAATSSFTTRPEDGWFIAQEKIAKFYGSKKDSNGNMPVEHFVVSSPTTTITQGLGTDFRLQFRVRNKSWGGIGFTYYDTMEQGNPYVRIQMRDWMQTLVRYEFTGCGSTCKSTNWLDFANYNSQLWNGEWMYYRIEVYGTNFRISYSPTEAGSFTAIDLRYSSYDASGNWIQTTSDRYDKMQLRTAGDRFAMVLSVQQPLDIDDLKIWSLDAAGNLGAAVFADDFSTYSVAPPLPTDYLGSDGTVPYSQLPSWL